MAVMCLNVFSGDLTALPGRVPCSGMGFSAAAPVHSTTISLFRKFIPYFILKTSKGQWRGGTNCRTVPSSHLYLLPSTGAEMGKLPESRLLGVLSQMGVDGECSLQLRQGIRRWS